MLKFLYFSQICDEITVQIECFERLKVRKVIIQGGEIVMRDIDPQQVIRLVYN